jgi:hypothetical protein
MYLFYDKCCQTLINYFIWQVKNHKLLSFVSLYKNKVIEKIIVLLAYISFSRLCKYVFVF